MTPARLSLPKSLRMLTLAVAVAGATASLPAWADEYTDVSILLRSGKFSEALTKADQFLTSKPRDPQMRFIKGVILSESGKPNDAIATFTKLTEDYPELPEPYNNLAVLYASQNQLDKARTALEMAIRTNPSYTTAHENLGDVYAKLASQAYSKALQLDANNQAVQPKLALIRELFTPGTKVPRPTLAATPPAKPAPSGAPLPAPSPAATPLPAPATVASTKASAAPLPLPTPAAETKPSNPAAAPLPAPAAAGAAPAPAGAAPAAVPAAASRNKEVEAAVLAWAAAWAAKDMPKYLGAYGKDFVPPGGVTRSAWEEERRKRIVGKASISVKVSELNISVNGNSATARFHQSYNGGTVTASSRKTLELQKSGERWVIVKELAGS